MPTERDMIDAVNADDAVRVAALVAEDPTLVGARDETGVSAILLSRYRHRRDVTDALLAADPDLDAFEAAALGYIDRLRAWLEEDRSLATAFSPDGFTALHYTAFFGKPEAAKVLVAAGARVDVSSRNPLRVQPLHSAAAGRHHEVCRVLLAAGADVNATQQDDYTPLHAAAQHGDDELVELFLSAGADPTARLEDGRTPAQVAADEGHVDIATRLRQVAEGR